MNRTRSSFASTLGLAALLALGLAAGGAHASGGYGLTFGLYGHDATLGVDHVGYDGTGNPYTGDTKCSMKRPILCVAVDNSPRPNYSFAGDAFYQGWVLGHYATTPAIKGSLISSEADGDARCATAFGTGWKMSEWHDGAYVEGMDATHFGNTLGSLSAWPATPDGYGGSAQWGYGNIRSDTRYWVAINTTSGNCWNP